MYNWNILGEYEEKLPIAEQILNNRGITDSKEKKTFLNPPKLSFWFKNLPTEFILSLREAKKIIQGAMKENLPIIIHGDYDVDGICATAIIYSALKKELNYPHLHSFIPNRFEHGYGLSKDSIKEALNLIDSSKALFITVDSGITSVEEVEFLKKEGHLVIITDHHQKPGKLPRADCVIWHDQIVGASIAWMLAEVLGAKNKSYLGFAAVATITDLQPVTKMNRSIVKFGLEVLRNHPPPGLKKLMEVAGRNIYDITTYDLGWVIGPRLNASGRLEDAKSSLNLFLEEDEKILKDTAWELHQINSQRQDKTLEMYTYAMLPEGVEPKEIIISHNENYHEGIIGLVASKLVQRYHRPSIVISTNGDLAKGSVRSIPGIDIISLLREMEELFDNLGGHPMAAGFSIRRELIPDLENRVLEKISGKYEDSVFQKSLAIDLEIPAIKIGQKLLKEVEQLKPYGMKNQEPVFLSRNLGISTINFVGKENQHLSLKLYDGDNFYKAIFFNSENLNENITLGDKVDVVYTVKENNFNGHTYIDLILKDLSHSDKI